MEEIIVAAIRDQEAKVTLQWTDSIESVSWDELSNLYRIAPLGNKKASDLATVFKKSMFLCFVYDD